MSSHEPTKPYVYQPDPVNSPNYPRIYALAGPGVPAEHQDKRYTKDEAMQILSAIAASQGWRDGEKTNDPEVEVVP